MRVLLAGLMMVASMSVMAQPIWLDSPPPGVTAIYSRGVAGDIPPERNFLMRSIGDFTGGSVRSEILISLLFPPSESLFTDTVFIVPGENLNRPSINLGDPFFSRAIRIIGPEASNFGSSIAPAGDVNRDGRADYMIGAPFESTGGRIYVMRGTNYPTDRLFIQNPSTEEFIFMRIDGQPGEFFGASLSDGADISDDGFSDFFIASPNTTNIVGDSLSIGAAYILYGSSALNGTTQESSSFDPENSLTLISPPQPESEDEPFFNGFGSLIEPIGDFTGDGVTDLAIAGGSSATQPITARVYLVPGGQRASGFFQIDEAPVERVVVDFQLFDTAEQSLISDIAGGDLNGDGRNDLIVSFQGADGFGRGGARGITAVVFSSDLQDATITITPDSENVALLNHWNDQALFGAHVHARDGHVAIGAPNAQNYFAPDTRPGAVYVFDQAGVQAFSETTRVGRVASRIVYGASDAGFLGQSFDLFPDQSGDGVPELLLATGGTEDEAHLVGYIINSSEIAGDVNGDGVRDKNDLFFLLSPNSPLLDFNADASVDPLDWLILRQGFSLY